MVGWRSDLLTSHSNSIESTDGDELIEGLAETGAEFQSDEENQVNDHGIFATVTIGEDTEDQGADRAEHQSDGDTLGRC